MANEFEDGGKLAHLSDEQKESLKDARKLRIANSRAAEILEGMGIGVELAHPRIDHLMMMFHKLEIITDDQYIGMQLAWEKYLQQTLAPLLRDAQVAARKHIQPVRQEKRLLKPGKDF